MQRDEAIRELQLNLRAIRDRLNQDLDEMDARLQRLTPEDMESDLPKNPKARALVYEKALSRI